MSSADEQKVLAQAERLKNDPRWDAKVKAHQKWLEQAPADVETEITSAFGDPEEMSDYEREEFGQEVDQIVRAVDEAPRERTPDFLDPYRQGKVELGVGGIAEYSERIRSSLGLDIGRGEPTPTEVHATPSSPQELGGKAPTGS